MRISALVSAVAVAGVSAQNVTTGALGNATVVVNNPSDVTYVATLPETAFDTAAYPSGGNAQGQIEATAPSDGTGVVFTVHFSNLPTTGGPFTYHIHESPVPDNGNCTATGGHLNPFERADDPSCDSALPQTCQVGDLSGKHGKITSTNGTFDATYVDLYASTISSNAAFFGNLSFVLHYPNKTRITCANFELLQTSTNGTSTTATATGSSSATAAVTAAAGRTAAVGSGAGAVGVFALAVAAMAL